MEIGETFEHRGNKKTYVAMPFYSAEPAGHCSVCAFGKEVGTLGECLDAPDCYDDDGQSLYFMEVTDEHR